MNARDRHGDTPAHHAAAAGHLDCLLSLRHHPDYDGDAKNRRNKTALDDLPAKHAPRFYALYANSELFDAYIEVNQHLCVHRDRNNNTILNLVCKSEIDVLEKCQTILRIKSDVLSAGIQKVKRPCIS